MPETTETPGQNGPDTTDQQAAERSQEAQQGQPGEQEGEAEKVSPEELEQQVEKWKSLSRKNEAAAKKAAEDARKWQEYQDSRKTEDQKAAEERERLIAERDEAKLAAARYRAATEHGLKPEDLELLDGIPADQLEERAARLAERLKPARTPSPSAGIGRETPPNAGGSGDWLRDRLISTRK